jgi:hypothetical protein
MGYYGISQYRGDYYPVGRMGDYYPVGRYGDPGFFDFVSDIGSAIGGAVSKVTDFVSPIMKAAAPILGQINPAFGAAANIGADLTPKNILHFIDRPNPANRVLQMGPPVGPMMGPPSQGSFAMAASAPGTSSTSLMIPASATGPTTFLDRTVGPSLGLFRKQAPLPGGAHVSAGRHTILPADAMTKAQWRRDARARMAATGYKTTRRMNPLNPRALARSIRRARGFEKFARKVLRFTSPGKHVAGFKSGFGRRKKRS